MTRLPGFSIACLTVTLAGCCINEPVASVAVVVVPVDSISGDTITVGTTLSISGPECSITTTALGAQRGFAECSESGEYELELTRPGYVQWSTNLTVQSKGGFCDEGAKTSFIVARMQRQL